MGSGKALGPPRVARLAQGWHTWRASPLILFRPRNPLVLAFFLSCCRKAFRPGEKPVKTVYGPLLPAQDQRPRAGWGFQMVERREEEGQHGSEG